MLEESTNGGKLGDFDTGGGTCMPISPLEIPFSIKSAVCGFIYSGDIAIHGEITPAVLFSISEVCGERGVMCDRS